MAEGGGWGGVLKEWVGVCRMVLRRDCARTAEHLNTCPMPHTRREAGTRLVLLMHTHAQSANELQIQTQRQIQIQLQLQIQLQRVGATCGMKTQVS